MRQYATHLHNWMQWNIHCTCLVKIISFSIFWRPQRAFWVWYHHNFTYLSDWKKGFRPHLLKLWLSIMKIFPVHQTLQLWSDFWSTCTCEALVTFFASTQSFSSAHWPNTTTIVTLHNLVRHNLRNTTEKRIHCRKMSVRAAF